MKSLLATQGFVVVPSDLTTLQLKTFAHKHELPLNLDSASQVVDMLKLCVSKDMLTDEQYKISAQAFMAAHYNVTGRVMSSEEDATSASPAASTRKRKSSAMQLTSSLMASSSSSALVMSSRAHSDRTSADSVAAAASQ